jgi:hypothetical protein
MTNLEKILRVLHRDRWLTSYEISDLTGISRTGAGAPLVAGMEQGFIERVLRRTPGKGYTRYAYRLGEKTLELEDSRAPKIMPPSLANLVLGGRWLQPEEFTEEEMELAPKEFKPKGRYEKHIHKLPDVGVAK